MEHNFSSTLTCLWQEACRKSLFPEGCEKTLAQFLSFSFSKAFPEDPSDTFPDEVHRLSCSELALIVFPRESFCSNDTGNVHFYRTFRGHPPETEYTRSSDPAILAMMEDARGEERMERVLTSLPGYSSWSRAVAVPLIRPDTSLPGRIFPGALLAVPAGGIEAGEELTRSKGALRKYLETVLAPPIAGLLQNARIGRSAPRTPAPHDLPEGSLDLSEAPPSVPGAYREGRAALTEHLVGEGGGLRSVLKRIETVVSSSLPVLLLGESGTGKEVIARRIHRRSPRRDQPFIRVNCGAIAPELIDSELFGHERGAFTGAVKRKLGWFERAHGGTLLLDEIGDLPLPAQVRLLRVLQEGTFERVGGEEEISVDVRIVAATHRDLPGMIQQGAFREDLWYRLSGYPIVIPPLRERQEDIPALAHHFCQRSSRKFGIRTQSITGADVEILRSYQWPGNIRELASVMDRAVLLSEGGALDFHKALERIVPLAPDSPRESDISPAPLGAGPPAFPTLDEAMERHIRRALEKTRGTIEGPEGAARLLGINPHTLRARMRRQGIRWGEYRRSRDLSGQERRKPPR
ncbi:hypothetical protein AU468_05775 [Alkalispirochaeta sphaeroplastigenens]|uniref:Sigma-54 factor interaction domain-containing protein n=1 Tax=Alkalispirochaeta sphaeroplastigenens TaxID=1187066 RepID=A0A2S4JUA0_9SPIO|nr:sigma-54 dependent transcriptional regulator [Alkalispirochaeta sphaeroplastigenens]POR03063.1 hypothetical protein AU468_05775 [Alkalispirochaeta sphaeroplastigenens]